MKRVHSIVVCIAILIASTVLALPLRAAPEPNPVPESWELLLAPSIPMRIQVDHGSGPVTYWYMLYTATNKTGRDIDFHPEIARANEIESEVPADLAASMPGQAAKISVDSAIVGVHPKVFRAIKKRHAKTHPFLVSPVNAITRLHQGEDNALASVAVFADLNARVSKFTIYFGGLSGETMTKPNPSYRRRQASARRSADDESNPKFFVLRKTLAIPYVLPGDVNTRRHAAPALGRMTWVMR